VAAIGTRDQERKLGENCRKRQDAEGAALTALAKAQENEPAPTGSIGSRPSSASYAHR